jgi:hypothetical protein
MKHQKASGRGPGAFFVDEGTSARSKMTNDQIRMTNQFPMTSDEIRLVRHSDFVIHWSFWFDHWDF